MTMDIVNTLRAMGGYLDYTVAEQEQIELADIAELIESGRKLIGAQQAEITRLNAIIADMKQVGDIQQMIIDSEVTK